ncbi:MAG: hypothetical protein A2W26_03740 [Acidobacteria bacterium RBG_16_64_8]|nr:MAG: hypothetical protein A2W26_03740 [Acidobacteria bacterium RBG_16_64_8]
MAERPRKRSDPAKLRKERAQIVKDLESRLPPDAEDPESVARRRGAPPVIKGALVTGTQKRLYPT